MTQAREAGIADERAADRTRDPRHARPGLIGIITQLQAAEQAAGDPDGWRRHFAAATQLARESLSEARRSVDALRPEPLETGRLSDALADVAGRWSALYRIPAQVATTGAARPMPPEAEVALLRTAQEALANVAKHARAARVGVTLSYLENEVRPRRPRRRRGVRTGSARGRRERRRRRRRVRPDRDAPADRGPGRDAAGGVRAQRHRRLGLHSGRGGGGGGRERPRGQRAPIRLFIADDHPVVRDGLSGMFARDPEFEVLGEAADGVRGGPAGPSPAARRDPDGPADAANGRVTAITELARRGTPARVLVLTTYDTDSHVLPAIEAGATGYLLKDRPGDDLLRAVRAAAHGEAVLSPSVAARLMSQFRSRAPSTRAEPAQPARARGARAGRGGRTNREAAARLFIARGDDQVRTC